jgi:hypothetical protein
MLTRDRSGAVQAVTIVAMDARARSAVPALLSLPGLGLVQSRLLRMERVVGRRETSAAASHAARHMA